MTITIEKHWDGNVCEKEANGRIYVSHGRWQWVLTVDGDAVGMYDTKREAKFYAKEYDLLQISVKGRTRRGTT